MDRLLRGLKWLWGTSWPLYAALVLGANVVGAVTILVMVYLLMNLIVDVLYGVLDPRISHD